MDNARNADQYIVTAKSGAGPIDAGLGIVHAGSIVATTDDELALHPPAARLELKAGDRKCTGRIADLRLGPGRYDCTARFGIGDKPQVEKKLRLYLIDPSRVRRSFGARYGSLEYDLPVVAGPDKTQPWETLWKTGPVQDIVVDFEGPHKFVLWRGMSFAPSWALGNIMTCNFFAETVEPAAYRDCCEMMSDRECRYIHARVIHNSPARVVIHWRHPLCDSAYTICRDVWVDEMYYIYPDGVATRNVTIHLDPEDEALWRTGPRTGRRVPCSMIDAPPGKRSFNDMEFITVNPPGAASEDTTPLEALTILDADDFSQTYRWPTPPDFGKQPAPELNEYIFRMNYRHRPGVFIASPADGLQVRLISKTSAIRYEAGALVKDDRWVHVPDMPTKFYDCVHWPITRGYGTTPLTDVADYQDRPTHTFLGFANNAPVDVQPSGAVTWTWLSGIAPKDEAELRAKVRAWTSPPAIEGARYDAQQRAYVVADPGREVVLAAPWVRRLGSACFIFEGCDAETVRVSIDGESPDEAVVAVGTERTLDSIQTVITVRSVPSDCETIRFQRVQH